MTQQISQCMFIYGSTLAAAAMLKVFNLTTVENKRLHFIFHKIPHLLNGIETNLFANTSLDLTAITCSCTDSVGVLTVLTLFDFIRLKQIMVFWSVAFYVFTIIGLFCSSFPHFSQLLVLITVYLF